MKECRCPKCRSRNTVKNGTVWGKPRRKCQTCRYQFTRTTRRGKSLETVHTAVILHLFGLSMNAIGRLLKVSTPAVLYWIRNTARQLAHKPRPGGETVVLELDEMWHYLEKKLKNYGYGKPTAEPLVILLTGNAALVMGQRSKNSWNDYNNGTFKSTSPTAGKPIES